MKRFCALVAIALALALTACGGGGGGGAPAPSGPVASTLSFPLRAGLNTFRANGFSKTFNVTSTSPFSTGCNSTGSATITQGPANNASTLAGHPAVSAVAVTSLTFASCTSTASTTTNFYNPDYSDLGVVYGSGKYEIALTPFSIPNTVTVGSTGYVGRFTTYPNSSSTTSNGYQDISYVVGADTATTAIVTVVTSTYVLYISSYQLASTEQDKYRIDASGNLTLISIDNQPTTFSGDVYLTHLVLN